MAEFVFGLALGVGSALIVVVGLIETGRLRAGGRNVVDEVLQRNDEFRHVVRGPFEI